jgi:hypothetical protein
MAFGNGTETSSGYAQDKLNLTKVGYYVFYMTADVLMYVDYMHIIRLEGYL